MSGSELFHLTFLFLVVMDPWGNIPIFISFLKHFDQKRQRAIIIRELLIAFGFLILFLFFGQGFFQLFNVREGSLQMAGGIFLFILAIRMIFANPGHEIGTKIPKDPFIVPLAVPAVAGPGILATMALYGGSEGNTWTILIAVTLAWLITLPIILFSPLLKRFLGENGLVAIERLSGYLVVLVAVKMALQGIITTFFHAA